MGDLVSAPPPANAASSWATPTSRRRMTTTKWTTTPSHRLHFHCWSCSAVCLRDSTANKQRKTYISRQNITNLRESSRIGNFLFLPISHLKYQQLYRLRSICDITHQNQSGKFLDIDQPILKNGSLLGLFQDPFQSVDSPETDPSTDEKSINERNLLETWKIPKKWICLIHFFKTWNPFCPPYEKIMYVSTQNHAHNQLSKGQSPKQTKCKQKLRQHCHLVVRIEYK